MKRKLLGMSLLAALLLGTMTACGQPAGEETAPGASPILPEDGIEASPALPGDDAGIEPSPADDLLASPSPATTE